MPSGPGWLRWRFEYAAGGRLAASGGILPVLVPSTSTVRAVTLLPVVDPLGRRMERSFDTNGNIDRITLPGGAQFSYAYDGLMRLVRTLTRGGVWTREYDAAEYSDRVD